MVLDWPKTIVQRRFNVIYTLWCLCNLGDRNVVFDDQKKTVLLRIPYVTNVFVSVHCSPVVTCWESADILALLYVMFSCVLSLFNVVSCVRCGNWLYVSIPDLCLLPYFVKILSPWMPLTHCIHSSMYKPGQRKNRHRCFNLMSKLKKIIWHYSVGNECWGAPQIKTPHSVVRYQQSACG